MALALDERKVCLQQFPGAGLAGTQQAGHLVRMEARQIAGPGHLNRRRRG